MEESGDLTPRDSWCVVFTRPGFLSPDIETNSSTGGLELTGEGRGWSPTR